MTAEIICVECGGEGFKYPNDPLIRATLINNRDNRRTPCEAYQHGLNTASSEIAIYAHDDVSVFDPDWLPKVLALFENPNCVCVGLGGATELGREGLYKRPWRISDMARVGYASAQRDWQTHGDRLEGAKQVAVVDEFFMAVRTSFLRDIGGWPVKHLTHHCLGHFIACEAARHGKEVWAIGIDVSHFGGGTSTKPIYAQAKWLFDGSLVGDHQSPHVWIHQTYSDVLPIRIR